jgi:3,5-epimerase/4-reductase
MFRVNVMGTMSLIDLCATRDVHITNFATGSSGRLSTLFSCLSGPCRYTLMVLNLTGCIYSYDDEHPIGGKGFTEEDEPNFTGSFYSYTKSMTEKMCKFYDNLLILRLRMPISDDLGPRNFVTKITKYQRVVNIPNSMTILTDMLPLSIVMTRRRLKGVYNFTNPGAVSHNEILELYKQYIDPEFWYVNFTEEEQNSVLKAKRSNNTLVRFVSHRQTPHEFVFRLCLCVLPGCFQAAARCTGLQTPARQG